MGKMRNLVKQLILLLAFMCFLTSCGTQEGNSQQSSSSEYLNVQTSQKEIGTPSEDNENWRLLNAFFYRGEPVQVWYVKNDTADGLIDVYLYREDESTELLVSGISEEYRGTWFLDKEGNIYITTDKKLTRMSTEGIAVYSRTGESSICDICQMEDGTIWMLVQADDGTMKLATLDVETGKTTEKSNIKLENNRVQYIADGAESLLLLNGMGLWSVEPASGSMESLLDFAEVSYQLDSGIVDFRMIDEENVELLYNGRVETLQVGTVEQEKEVILIRNYRFDPYMEEYINQFNQQSDKYYVQMDRAIILSSDYSGLADFVTQTNLELINGGGADILGLDSIGDAVSCIEKGVIEDLKPYLEASGMKEEDYFPITFDGYRDGDRIYSMKVYISGDGLCLDKSLTGGVENPSVETVVDALLNAPQETILRRGYTASRTLQYFLQGSDSLWGMVDWETQTCDFDSELFAKLLETSKLRGFNRDNPYVESAKSVSDMTFFTYEFEEYVDSEGMQKIGYFFDDGCRMAMDSAVWFVNSNSKNKEGAWEFLRFLLNEDFQVSWEDPLFPTNRKAFERVAQREMEAGPIETMPNGSLMYKADTSYYETYGEDAYIERFGLTTEKIDEIREQIENVRALPSRITPLIDIILEEAAYYFNDTKSIQEVIPIIENRVQLYLDEHQ